MKWLRTTASLIGCLFATLAGLPAAAETGVTDTSILLGMSSPFSGPNGAYGQEMREIISAYFAQINKGGGINGRKLELAALDDGYETERAVANTRTLIEDKKVFALIGFYGENEADLAIAVNKNQQLRHQFGVSPRDAEQIQRDLESIVDRKF